MGSRESAPAETALSAQVRALGLPEAEHFLEVFGSSFSLSLDEPQGPHG